MGFGLVLILTTTMTFVAMFNMSKVQDNLERIVTASNVQAAPAADQANKSGTIAALYSDSKKMYENSRLLMFILTSIVIAVASFIALFLTRGIVRPLNEGLKAFEALAEGNLNKDVM
jgi:methyl-accepting chemotaxis protein